MYQHCYILTIISEISRETLCLSDLLALASLTNTNRVHCIHWGNYLYVNVCVCIACNDECVHEFMLPVKCAHFLLAHYQVDLTVAVLDEAFSHPLHKNTNVRYIHFVAQGVDEQISLRECA